MVIKSNRVLEFVKMAEFAIAHKAIYQEASRVTGMPWAMIAIIHRREGDSDFNTYLGNGQSLKRKTTIVPKGRGPFLGPKAFIDGCIDSIRQEGWARIADWTSLERALFYCELFNGAGYDAKGLPSPYLWGGTNIQRPGKYIKDHVFSTKAMDSQPGCAPLLQQIMQLDPSIIFARESA